MNNKVLFFLLSLFTLSFVLMSTVEAKRFGGGASFGGKKSYSSPFKSSPSKKSFNQRSASQKKAATTNQQRKQHFANKGGLMGMLGGLALGGLLGALFFGGAFENFNFFDFFIIGAIIFAVIWFLKRKRPSPQMNAASSSGYGMPMEPQDSVLKRDNSNSGQATNTGVEPEIKPSQFNQSMDSTNSPNDSKDVSFAESFGMGNQNQTEHDAASGETTLDDTHVVNLPEDFDIDDFLEGAKAAYSQIQQAWTQGDLESIQALTTEAVYNEIVKFHNEEPATGETRILQLNAQLIDFNQREEHNEASVMFDALLTETDTDGEQGRPAQVRELWHFIRAQDSSEPTWYLDGIQQLES